MSDVKESNPMSYSDCCAALLQLWIDNVLTDNEYYRIIDKLNKKQQSEEE